MNKNNKRYIIETIFLKESLKHDLSLNEFLVLVYFDNDYDQIFDVKKIAKALCLNEKDVLKAFESLSEKGLITLTSAKNESGKLIDKVSLDALYNGIISNNNKAKKEEQKHDLFSKFQESYGHSLSGMDYEIINAWLTSGYSEELILGALEEANYNGVSSLRYIDKILYEWHKKGFKKMSDVTNHLKSKADNEEKLFETKVMEYNWLDEE